MSNWGIWDPGSDSSNVKKTWRWLSLQELFGRLIEALPPSLLLFLKRLQEVRRVFGLFSLCFFCFFCPMGGLELFCLVSLFFFGFEHDLWHLGSFFLIVCCENWLFFGVGGGKRLRICMLFFISMYTYTFLKCGIHLQDVLKQIGGIIDMFCQGSMTRRKNSVHGKILDEDRGGAYCHNMCGEKSLKGHSFNIIYGNMVYIYIDIMNMMMVMISLLIVMMIIYGCFRK